MGQNRWHAEKDWPLPQTRWRRYYLHSGGKANSLNGDGVLSTTPPGDEPPDEAQGVFAAIWSADPAAAWFPTRDLVRQAVEAADMEDWFEEAGVVLPEWLSER
jgi:predicted acyl esterase